MLPGFLTGNRRAGEMCVSFLTSPHATVHTNRGLMKIVEVCKLGIRYRISQTQRWRDGFMQRTDRLLIWEVRPFLCVHSPGLET
jgi:hypothetical protein